MQTLSITKEITTLWAKAEAYPSFRAFVRILRVAVAAGTSAFFATLIPQLQADPAIGGVPLLALVLLGVDKYLRDKKVY